MKTQETEIKVLSKETKTGTSNGRDWTIDEYTICETVEREDGSLVDTKVRASTTGSVGDLAIGATYKVVIYITSRESEKSDGSKSIWNSFRITRAELVGDLPKAQAKTVEELTGDDLPF